MRTSCQEHALSEHSNGSLTTLNIFLSMPVLHIPLRRPGGRQPRDVPPSKPRRSRSLTRQDQEDYSKLHDSCSSNLTQPTCCMHDESWSSLSTQGDACYSGEVPTESFPLSPCCQTGSKGKGGIASPRNSHLTATATMVPSRGAARTRTEPKKVRIVCPPPNRDQVLALMQLDPLSQLRSDSCSLHGLDSPSESSHSRDFEGLFHTKAIEDYENICRQFEREY